MIGSNPLVSIVVPCYNQGNYLKQAIESVLSQSYPRLELIVLDDGSKDNTPEVLASYAGRFRYESQANMGQAATLNKGWRLSKGEILSYLAADDFLLQGAVARAVTALVTNPAIVLTYSDYNRVDPESRVIWRVHTQEFSYRNLAVGLICQPGPGVFFTRDAFGRAGFWNETLRHTPDFEYWLRLGLEGGFLRIPEVLAAYRMHAASQSLAAASPQQADEMVNVVSAHFRNPKLPAGIALDEPQAMSNAHVVSARQHLRSGRFFPAWAHMRDAFRLYPRSYLRARNWRMLLNGLINRLAYKTLGRVNKVLSRK